MGITPSKNIFKALCVCAFLLCLGMNAPAQQNRPSDMPPENMPWPRESQQGQAKPNQSPENTVSAPAPAPKPKPTIKIITAEPNPGEKDSLISIELKDVDIENALKIIAQASGLNIVLDKDVKAKVNTTVKNVSWQKALDTIVKTNGLTYKMEGDILRVMTPESIKKEEDLTPLTTKIIGLNFAKVGEISKSLGRMLSGRGSIEIDVPTNSLIITDIPEKFAKVEDIIRQLDKRTPQVMIEALIMSVKLTDQFNAGSDFTLNQKDAFSGGTSYRQAKQSILGTMASVMNLTYGKTILPNWNFSETLELYAKDSRVKILASPRILTLDNLQAQIDIIQQIPYTQQLQSDTGTLNSSTQFKDAGIKLVVTPHITKDRFISVNVNAEQSFLADTVGGQPQIDSRKVNTSFMLKDGYTVVIGGLKSKERTVTFEKTPILGDIPFIGKYLFGKKQDSLVDTEVLIFISPHILDESLISDRDIRIYEIGEKELLSAKKNPEVTRASFDETTPASAPATHTVAQTTGPAAPVPDLKALREDSMAETLNDLSATPPK